jgi:site-specific DNA-methyltransferase (adenine-specific)
VSAAATPADVLAGTARWCVVEGDCLAVLASLPDGCIDAVVTDPPYSSGGAFRSDRAKSTDSKYTGTQHQGKRPDFAGDVRDQRSFAYWCALWMGEALRCAVPDARLVAFADWRQLPTLTDAIQSGGWIWRGVASWDKGDGARPTPGGFKAQCEYIAWASNGPLPAPVAGVTILPGSFSIGVKQDDKHHQTGKPTPLMREVVKIAKPGGVILDPFAGSGTTGVAALAEGRRVILCERVPEYAAIARARLAAAEAGTDWRAPASQPSLFAAVGS